MSVAALLDHLDEIAPAVREAIRARTEISTGAPAASVGADDLVGVAGVSDDPSHGIAGGNQRLAHELAAVLGNRVHLRSAVTAVTWSDDAATVRTGDAELDADAVVVAVPAPLLDAHRVRACAAGGPPRGRRRARLRARGQALRPASCGRRRSWSPSVAGQSALRATAGLRCRYEREWCANSG